MLRNSRVARVAAIFSLKLCRAILGGLRNQLGKNGVLLNGHVGRQEYTGDSKVNLTHDEDDDDDDCGYNLDGSLHLCASKDVVETRHGQILKFDTGEGPFFDDLTKQQLPTSLVKAARKKELDDFEMKSVWKRVPAQDAWKLSGRPPITVRWVDVNKGDDEVPDIRSRLVARQIRGCNEDPMSAPAPPLEAVRTVFS